MTGALHPADLALIGIYFGFLIFLGVRLFGVIRREAAEYLVMGRRLALPSFVATLVTTWYGGVLGVGEFSYRYGISNWLVFGVPYYVGAALFALLVARRARRSMHYTVPDQLAHAYGRGAGLMGAGVIQILSTPAPYVLMLGVLLQMIFGGPLWLALVVGTVFATGYSLRGGLRSVVRADNLQFVLMFAGFIIALPLLAWRFGGWAFLKNALPETHFVWHGGNPPQYIFVWYLIAMQTLVEPTFYQRAFSAKDERTAARGVLIAIGFWMLFDFLTTFTGMYARALLPALTQPVAAYPTLAIEYLPPVVRGLFYLGLLATVMSTVDGYTFIGGVNFGRDILWRLRGEGSEEHINRYVAIGFAATAISGLLLALLVRSVVDLWHHVGSIGVPALLVPLLTSYTTRWRMPARLVPWAMFAGGAVALVWLLMGTAAGANGVYPLGIEPIYVGLAVSAAIWIAGWATRRHAGGSGVVA